MSARLRIETGGATFLAVCSECRPWRELKLDRAAALLAAATHAVVCHDDAQQAGELRRRAHECA